MRWGSETPEDVLVDDEGDQRSLGVDLLARLEQGGVDALGVREARAVIHRVSAVGARDGSPFAIMVDNVVFDVVGLEREAEDGVTDFGGEVGDQ